MGGMDFAIATPTRKASEDALLKEAVTAFKSRAQLATDALGGKSYKNRQPEPQQQRLSTTVHARADDDESCRHGFRAGDARG